MTRKQQTKTECPCVRAHAPGCLLFVYLERNTLPQHARSRVKRNLLDHRLQTQKVGRYIKHTHSSIKTVRRNTVYRFYKVFFTIKPRSNYHVVLAPTLLFPRFLAICSNLIDRCRSACWMRRYLWRWPLPHRPKFCNGPPLLTPGYRIVSQNGLRV